MTGEEFDTAPSIPEGLSPNNDLFVTGFKCILDSKNWTDCNGNSTGSSLFDVCIMGFDLLSKRLLEYFNHTQWFFMSGKNGSAVSLNTDQCPSESVSLGSPARDWTQ